MQVWSKEQFIKRDHSYKSMYHSNHSTDLNDENTVEKILTTGTHVTECPKWLFKIQFLFSIKSGTGRQKHLTTEQHFFPETVQQDLSNGDRVIKIVQAVPKIC